MVIDKGTTTIIGDAGDKAAIDARIASIRREIDDSASDYDKEKPRERLARVVSQ